MTGIEEAPMKPAHAFWLAMMCLAVFLPGCGGGESPKSAGDKLYDIRGKVVAIDATKPAVTLDHEDIPGLMKAMEMEFGVETPKLLEGLKVGDGDQGKLKKT